MVYKQFEALDDAVRALNIKQVQKVLTKNPKLLKRRVDRDFVLIILEKAIILRSAKIIELFARHDADLNFGDPLRKVIADGNLQLTKLLLKNGARPQNVDGLFSSTKNMSILRSILAQLLQHGFKPRADMLNSFIRRCDWQEGNQYAAEVVELLIDSGVPVNHGETLYSALDTKDVSFVSLLLSKGADVNLAHEDEISPLHYAARCDLDEDISELLISNGAQVNLKGPRGRTPLHSACCDAGAKVVKLLVMKGADVNAKDDNGRTPLHEACIYQRFLVLSFLIQKGADVNAKDAKGNTPFSLLKYDSFRENYAVCFYVLLREYAKLLFERARVPRSYTALIKPMMSPELKQTLRDYAEELERMSRTPLWGNYTYYSVLKGSLSLRKLALLIKDERLTRRIEINMCGFRYFKKDLSGLFEEALYLRNRLIGTECRLEFVFGDNLPERALKRMARCLSIYDLPLPGEPPIYTECTLGHFF